MTSIPRGEAKPDANGKKGQPSKRADFALGLLREAARVSPILRDAVDDVRDEVRRLRLALEESADFRCFNENRVGDPCACCEHVIEIADEALGKPAHRTVLIASKEPRRGA